MHEGNAEGLTSLSSEKQKTLQLLHHSRQAPLEQALSCEGYRFPTDLVVLVHSITFMRYFKSQRCILSYSLFHNLPLVFACNGLFQT